MPDQPPAGIEALRLMAQTRTTMSVPEAGRFFGLGENTSYELHKRGEFPVRVLQLGKKLRVPVAEVVEALGFSMDDLR